MYEYVCMCVFRKTIKAKMKTNTWNSFIQTENVCLLFNFVFFCFNGKCQCKEHQRTHTRMNSCVQCESALLCKCLQTLPALERSFAYQNQNNTKFVGCLFLWFGWFFFGFVTKGFVVVIVYLVVEQKNKITSIGLF